MKLFVCALLTLALTASVFAADAKETSVTDFPAAMSKEQIATVLQDEGQLFVYWPMSPTFKVWMHNIVIPAFTKHIKATYGVETAVGTLASGSDPAFWQRLAAYKQGNAAKGFDVDIVRVAPNTQLLEAIQKGWFAPLSGSVEQFLPNLKNINPEGRKTFELEGKLYAMPFYQPTISLVYNADKIPTPPKSFAELAAWIEKNPKQFTYEDPRNSSGIGSGTMFLTAVMHAFGNEKDPKTWSKGWDFIKKIQPNVAIQPTDSIQVLELFRRGEISMAVFWTDWAMQYREDNKVTFLKNALLDTGLPVRNTPFAIPAGARHPLTAALFLDFVMSAEIQSSLGNVMHQMPASIDPKTWAAVQPNAFGFTYEIVQKNTFLSFNNKAMLANIDLMAPAWSKEILGK